MLPICTVPVTVNHLQAYSHLWQTLLLHNVYSFGLGMWPTRSPDLTSLGLLWGHMKDTICRQKSRARQLAQWVMDCSFHWPREGKWWHYQGATDSLLRHILSCVCGSRYPACIAHAPCCHLWPAQLYSIFPHYVVNGTIFEKKKLLNIKCAFWFFCNFCLKLYHSLNNRARHDNNVFWSLCKVSVIFVSFWGNLNFRDTVSKNTEMSNFFENTFSGSWIVPCGQTNMTNLIIDFFCTI